ncbi:phage upper tail fiber protein [Devosia riboflavina]|uniref:phage upper tail fiber protein n=1 Tax=Devosia riboflavina TaxID=46914 RepID=UPI0006907C8B|nr:hypothetical protein [Devosia riboflavina]
MANTVHRGYPLPDVARDIDEEFFLFQLTVLPAIDLDIHNLIEAVAGKADSGHGHAIAQIEGLIAALEGKMPAETTFTLASLSDVVGMADAPDGYIPVKVGDQVVFQAAVSALGDHDHTITQVTGLSTALDEKTAKSANLSDLANVLTARANLKIVPITQAAYDALTKDPDTLYFIY